MTSDIEKLRTGKLAHHFLARLLATHATADERIIVGPAIGEDATVIDMGDRYLIAKTDPITFVAEQIGYYAVQVNTNDIVCMGGQPKWFLATLLLPEKGTTAELVEAIFAQIADVCRQEKIAFCGGHTEVTVGIDRPIAVGQMLGEVAKDKLITKKGARENDVIILVKEIPIEGTTIIAREKAVELKELYSEAFVRQCQNLLFSPGIGVRREAEIALAAGEVHAMHDPTEGGLATALHELATAAGLGVRIDYSRIPFLPEGKLLCDQYELNPLGCISSGSLLLVVSPKVVQPILTAFAAHRIVAAEIGLMTALDCGKTMLVEGKEVELPIFPQDEIGKIFA